MQEVCTVSDGGFILSFDAHRKRQDCRSPSIDDGVDEKVAQDAEEQL